MLEVEHQQADGLDVRGTKENVQGDKGQRLLMRWRKLGCGQVGIENSVWDVLCSSCSRDVQGEMFSGRLNV